MCNICENLVNVPKDKKGTIILQNDESEFTNLDKTIIEVNHNEKGERYAFITHQLQLKNNRMWSHPIYIKYCPFCGENLKVDD